MNIFVENGKEVKELTERESRQIKKKAKPVTEITKNMTQEELEVFKKERYEKFIKPLMEHNQNQLKSLQEKKQEE